MLNLLFITFGIGIITIYYISKVFSNNCNNPPELLESNEVLPIDNEIPPKYEDIYA